MKTISWKQKQWKRNKIFTEPEARGQYSISVVVKLSYWSGGGGGCKKWASLAQGKVIFKIWIIFIYVWWVDKLCVLLKCHYAW